MLLSCLVPVVINLSTDVWESIDFHNLKSASIRCGEIYKKSPCVAKFVKVKDRTYHIYCGEKKNGNLRVD